MIYHTRDEVERIGQAGSAMWIDPKGIKGTAFRYLSSFWLFVEERDEAFTPHGLQGYWEAWITTWMSKQFDQHKEFVDIGANVGYYTMMAASHGLRVTSIEPNPAVVNLLRASIRLNQFEAAVLPWAASNFTGPTHLSIPDRHSGGAHVADTGVRVSAFETYQLMPAGKTLVKIDAEGHEPQIVKGMVPWCINNIYTILLEWDKSRFDADKFAQELFELGTVFYVDFSGNEVPLIHWSQLAKLDGLQMVGVRNWQA